MELKQMLLDKIAAKAADKQEKELVDRFGRVAVALARHGHIKEAQRRPSPGSAGLGTFGDNDPNGGRSDAYIPQLQVNASTPALQPESSSNIGINPRPRTFAPQQPSDLVLRAQSQASDSEKQLLRQGKIMSGNTPLTADIPQSKIETLRQAQAKGYASELATPGTVPWQKYYEAFLRAGNQNQNSYLRSGFVPAAGTDRTGLLRDMGNLPKRVKDWFNWRANQVVQNSPAADNTVVG